MDVDARPQYIPPLGNIETTLARIWSQVLSKEPIGREDDFIRLGGTADTAAWVVEKVRQTLRVRLSVAVLLNTRSLSGIARTIRARRRRVLTPIFPAPRSATLPLSFNQERLWFVSTMQKVSEAYHVPLAYRLRGSLNAQVLQQALDRLVWRHETLRTRFEAAAGECSQRIDPPDIGCSLLRDDLSRQTDTEQQLSAIVSQEATAPFNLESGPLVRGRLVRLAENDHALLITLHHINSDALSVRILVRELGALYRAALHREPDPLAPLQIQYADYAIWQRQWLYDEAMIEQGEYWRTALDGAPELLQLPTDRRRPQHQTFASGVVELNLDEKLTQQLRSLSRRSGTTLYSIAVAAWAMVLSRLSGQEDVVIGMTTANRPRPEVQGLIGFFVNALPLRIDLSADPTIDQLLERTQAVVLAAQEHQDLPLERLVELVKPVRNPAYAPLFQVMLSWQNDEGPRLELDALEVAEIHGPPLSAKFDLTLSFVESGPRIIGNLNYATALFDTQTARRHAGYVHRMLMQMGDC